MSTNSTPPNPVPSVTQLREEFKSALAAAKKPTGWRRRSVAPFFKERFALEIKAELDKMMADPEKNDYMFHYSEWSKLYTPNSLYLYIYQACRYLVEYLDPNRIYFNHLESIGIKREAGRGIRLFYHKDVKQGVILQATARPVTKGKPDWQVKVDNFLENAHEGEHLTIPNLVLTPDEVKALEESFVGVTGVEFIINNHEIKLLKITL